MLPADLIRDLPQTNMVPDMVLEFLSVPEGHCVDNHVIVDGVCVQVGGDDHLILVTPHTPGCFNSNLMRLLRRDLSGLKALKPVIGHVRSPETEAPLNGYHFFIGSVLGAVHAGDIHLAVGLVIVCHILQRLGQVVIQILSLRGFVRVVGVVDDGFQIALHRPEACGSHQPSLPGWITVSRSLSRTSRTAASFPLFRASSSLAQRS